MDERGRAGPGGVAGGVDVVGGRPPNERELEEQHQEAERSEAQAWLGDAGGPVALEEVDDGIWNIVYYNTLLGKIDERTLLITGV